MSDISELLETHALGSSRITARTFVETNEAENDVLPQQFLLLEGSRESLKFLADLILAQIDSDSGCNIYLHPTGPGSSHFSPSSTAGIYIHRLPCDVHPDNVIK